YADGVLYNPSLGASFGEKDDFAIVGNAGAVATADAELIDDLEDFRDFLDELEALSTVDDLTPDLADRAIAHLENLENQQAQVGAGANLVIAIPNQLLSLSVISRSRISASVVTLVDSND